MRYLLLICTILLNLLLTNAAFSHALDPGYLEITALDGKAWRVTWRMPNVQERPMAIMAQMPKTCSNTEPSKPVFDGRAWLTSWITPCPDGLAGGEIIIDGLEKTRTDVLVRYEIAQPAAQRDSITVRSPWLVSFGFGLIHGLGFAGALPEIGLPEQDIGWALFSFNLGVEIGQVFFVMLVMMSIFIAKKLYPKIMEYAAKITLAASYAIGGIASFWLIERIMGFW